MNITQEQKQNIFKANCRKLVIKRKSALPIQLVKLGVVLSVIAVKIILVITISQGA